MKKFILLLHFAFYILHLQAQNVGIGTATPNANAILHVDLAASTSKGLLVTGTYNGTSSVPDLGAGSRMIFYPGKAAFRAGHIDGAQWNNVNVGPYSTAIGHNTTASGNFSTAIGSGTTASGAVSIAMGTGTTASGTYSTALGVYATASGAYSTALGGYNATASGNTSTAFGFNTTAGGSVSTAMGSYTTASGDQSTALGNYVSTSSFNGAFAIGDNSTTTVMESFVANGFRARFAGGYRLLTNSAATIGVVLLASGNAWSAISDVRQKENFIPVDGELFLNNIANMPLTTWNYKGQDSKTLRHYGPMAQDFYKAFGRDELGEIGCDTLINQQDFLGVNLIAIQALEKRTTMMKAEGHKLKVENAELRYEVSELKTRLERLEKLLVK